MRKQQQLHLPDPHRLPQVMRVVVPRAASWRRPSTLEKTMAALALSAHDPVALEVTGGEHGIAFQVRASRPDGLAHLRQQVQALYPQARLERLSSREDPLHLWRGEAMTVVELVGRGKPYLSLRTPPDLRDARSSNGDDPLLAVLGALQDLPAGTRAVVQLALVPASPQWARAHLRKAVEHPLEREREQRRRGDTGPSTGTLVALGMLVALALIWRQFGTQILPLVPPWMKADALVLLEGHLPLLTATQIAQLVSVVVVFFGLSFLVSRGWNRIAGSSPLYDMRAVGEKTKRVAYHACLRLIVIGSVPTYKSWRRDDLPLWTWVWMRYHQRREHKQIALRLAAVYRQYDNPAGNVLVPHVAHLRRAHLIERPARRYRRRLRTGAPPTTVSRRLRICWTSLYRLVQRCVRRLVLGQARWERGVARSRFYLSVEEVAALWHLVSELDAPDVPGLERTVARTRPLPPQLQHTRGGNVLSYQLGSCLHAGWSSPVYVLPDVLRQNSLAVAATGKGKSTLFAHLALCHLSGNKNDGLFYMEPHGDTIAALLGSIPPERAEDVTLIDLSDEKMVVGLNPLDMSQGRSRDKTVDNVLSVLTAFWQKQRSWGPRTENIMQFALLALCEANQSLVARDDVEQQYTLLDIILLLQRYGFRQRVLSDVHDPVVHDWFKHYYELLRPGFRDEMISPVLNKISKYAAAKVSRRLLGQSRATVRLSDDIRAGRALLINTASGIVGEEVSALIGATLVGLFQTALAEQIQFKPEARRRFWVVIDEFQTYLGIDYNTMLAELRKYGGSFALATQSLSYLDEVDKSLKPTVLTNSDHLFCFAMEAADAKTLAPYLDGLEPIDLMNQDAYTCYARWTKGGQRLPAFSLRLASPPASEATRASAIRERSNERHAREVEVVDLEVAPVSKQEPAEPRGEGTAGGSDDEDGGPADVAETREQLEPSRRRGGRGKGGKHQASREQRLADGTTLTEPYVLNGSDALNESGRLRPRAVFWSADLAERDESGEGGGE